jgi:glycine/D-amino acid oxidase-like deaminating enzyme
MNPTGGHINPLGLARGLAAAAIKAGVRVYGGSPATGLAATGQGWRIGTPAGAVVAKRVLLATAAYTDDLWPGLKRSVVPVRSYQMATRPLSDNLRKAILPADHAMSDTRGDLHFCHFDRDGRLVTGGALLIPDDDGKRIKAHIGERLAWLFPELGTPDFDHVWHGQIAMTPDRLPHLHELAPGLWSWLGCNGRGVALATAMGPVLTDAIKGVPHGRLAMAPTPLRPIQAHALLAALARGMLLLYRWRDARD